MTRQIVKKSELDEPLKEKAMNHLLKSESDFTPQTVARELDVSVSDALGLLSDSDFVKLLNKKKIQLVRIFLNTTAVKELMTIVQCGADKDRIAASKLLFEIAGYRERGSLVSIQQNFGELQPGQPGWIDQQVIRMDERRRQKEAELSGKTIIGERKNVF